MPINMGMGRLGDNAVIHKRKFRWTFEVVRSGDRAGQVVPASFVKVAARPNLSVEETEINFLNAKRFIPGKGTFETMTITYYDVAEPGEGTGNVELWNWLLDVYDFSNAETLRQSSKRDCYSGTGIIAMYDGCGNALEKWELLDCWPNAVDFGELDYAVSDVAEVTVTLRYGGVNYNVFCGTSPSSKGCCGCPTGDPYAPGGFVGSP
jgi:hypothetical protein